MKLIADSGSTKTDWLIVGDGIVVERFSTSGLNPSIMGLERFGEVLRDELAPRVWGVDVTEVEFYGAGCTEDKVAAVRGVMAELLPSARDIVVESDMMGACRAVCGDKEGIVAILGTGSNSCLYDGRAIVMSIPSLGFILGDEGSGAALGRLFLNALLKRRVARRVEDAFAKEFALTKEDILARVYEGRDVNVFLASFAQFVRRWSIEDGVRELIVDNFRLFFANNIRQYERRNLLVYCVGSMAHYFSDCLEDAAEAEGYQLGEIVKSPIERLLPR